MILKAVRFVLGLEAEQGFIKLHPGVRVPVDSSLQERMAEKYNELRKKGVQPKGLPRNQKEVSNAQAAN